MSYIQSTLKCQNCGHEMNVHFGVQGVTVMWEHPRYCPKCKSDDLKHLCDGWHANNDK